jgi:uncharacterized protein (DUF885 family)
MRISPALSLFTLSLLIATPALSAPDAPAPMAARLAVQNALFEEYYQAELKASPERATAYGDYRYNDQLDDYSLAGIAYHHAVDESFLARLTAIATEGFAEQDKLSHELLMRIIQQRIANHAFHEYEMPSSQIDGPHLELADLPLAVPLDTVKHYEDYIARLHQIPRVFAQTIEVMRAGMRDHLMPVRFLLEKVPGQCQGVISADPFLTPTQKYPAEISAADQQRLTKEITDAVNNEVLPAYKNFAAFVANEYAPHGRTALSVTSLPGGAARYRNDIKSETTIGNMTPDQIHQLGLREIARIQADMLAIAHKEGYPDLAGFREALKSSPKYARFRPTSGEEILDDFRKYIGQMQPKLPELFTVIPGSPVTVEAIPDFQAAEATHYQTGTPDGKRPGRVVVATSNVAERSMIDDEATAYHEGIPGHHMQLSVAQQLTGLPKFRMHGGNAGYVEGWALYSEQLGKEIGFYQDPVSDYGRLTSELFRAVRLVVDTGLHAKGWTRDQVVDLFRKTGPVDEPTIQSETDRYIAWPGQALAYKLGQLKIRELREKARQALGPKFDIRTFHDEILNGGVLPLDMLEARMDAWMAAQQH